MPRKVWKQKNRYCWNSNLSEEMFLVLLRLYCTGYTGTRATEVIARYARRYVRKKISRQTVNRYYLLLGDYLYEMLPDHLKIENTPLEAGDDMPTDEEERKLYIARVILYAIHHGLYDKFAWNDPINEIALGSQSILIHHLLSALSKTKRGYPLKTFNAHLAYAFWCLWIQLARPDEPVWKVLFEIMQEALEAAPLDMRYNQSIRIAKS